MDDEFYTREGHFIASFSSVTPASNLAATPPGDTAGRGPHQDGNKITNGAFTADIPGASVRIIGLSFPVTFLLSLRDKAPGYPGKRTGAPVWSVCGRGKWSVRACSCIHGIPIRWWICDFPSSSSALSSNQSCVSWAVALMRVCHYRVRLLKSCCNHRSPPVGAVFANSSQRSCTEIRAMKTGRNL